MAANREWGPLAGLIGEWEGDQGLDISFHNVERETGETKFREKVTMKPFGPVDNGLQHLYGLDYRMAAWREGEENPFHTEVGYWLWDAEPKQVMRCFMVPRGAVLIAGGTVEPSAKTFTLEANRGDDIYGILQNQYLSEKANTTKYVCTVKVEGDTWSYDELTTYNHYLGGDIAHVDRNTLHKVAEA